MFESLGHYKILDRIGAGGMGEVFRGRDTRAGRTVAIKVIVAGIAGEPARRERFLRDARAAAELSHPNIAALYEIGEDQNQLFLVFEFVPGETLATLIGGRPLNPRRTVDHAVQVADALAEAHAAGIVHRDIKPSNIMVTPKGNAKVLDFGLTDWTSGGAQRAHAVAATTEPGEAAAPGTVQYMSPEQALDERVDYRTDIFSLGTVIFEMLTGRPPFAGASLGALGLQIIQAPTPVPSSANASLPDDFDRIVTKALAKSIDQRYESAATLAAELRSVGAILDVRSDAAGPEIVHGPIHVPEPPSRRWLVLLLLLAALAAVAWWQRDAIADLWRGIVGG